MERMRRDRGVFLSSQYTEPYEVWGTFVLDGASDPSEFAGHIVSVTREANATPTILFRVTLLDDFPGLGTGNLKINITAMARGPEGATNDTQVYNVNVLTEGIDPAPAGVTFTTGNQIDVIVVESAMGGAAVGTAVDTAGIIVAFVIRGDRVSG